MSKATATMAIECDHCGADEFYVYGDPQTGDMRITCTTCETDLDATAWRTP